MSTTFGSFEEFWAAMGRLYDQTLKHEALIAENAAKHEALIAANAAQISQVGEQMQATDARLDRIASMVATVAGTVAKQSEQIESHERRLERLEGRPD
jgi:ABC-type transporter Mla subunit MlaD